MKDSRTRALARLRAADPAPTMPDAAQPYARAMLERVVEEQQTPGRPRPRRRRLALALAGAGLAVAAVTATVIVEPWSAFEPAAAYAVDQRSDGSVAVTIRADQLKNPARLNAELARRQARTVVMEMVAPDQCDQATPIHPLLQVPAGATPEQLAEHRSRRPVDYEFRDEGVDIVIKPWLIPPGETLVIGYTRRATGDERTTKVLPVIVMKQPACLVPPSR